MPLTDRVKYGIITSMTLIVVLIACMVEPFGQSPLFHSFADTRTILNIPNGLNVTSNLPFIFIGIFGLCILRRHNIAMIYGVMFTGILLTGIGSAYYHYHPDNNTLVYDRIPMTIVFTAFLTATIAERISLRWGTRLLFPFVGIGIASVLWWYYTEQIGAGDLRPYMVVQFYPILLIPVIFIFFPAPGSATTTRYFMWIIAWYLVAKIFERFDKEIFSTLGFISGHSLKHMGAAVSTWYILQIYQQKRPEL